MPNGEISQIQLPNGDMYDIRDGNVSDFKTNIDEETLVDGQILKYNEETGEWENIEEVDPTDITNTASGSIATFTDGGDNIPVNSFECSIVAQQESGTPTPASPLLITGFSQSDISVCGLNIFDEEMETGTLDNSTGETAIDNNKMRSVNFIPVKPNTTYSVYNNTGVNLYIYSYGADKSFIEFDNTGMITGSTFTTDSNTYYIKFRTQNNPSYSNNISINYSSSDDDYHAYTGALYTVSFGQTIYGGRLIYSNGQWAIEATHGYVNLGSLTYGTGTGGNARFTALLPLTPIAPQTATNIADIISDIYETTSSTNIYSGSGNYQIAIHTNGLLWIRNTDYSDINTFKTAMNGHCIVYALATPTIIPITSSTRVKTISGLNNIYSNTGDVYLEYFVNKADDIDKLINAEKSTESSDYHVYSTDEQVVGKWIDGSTIYEKTFTATFTNIAHNTPQNMVDVSGLGIADVIRVFGSCKYDSTTPSVQPTLYESLGGHFYCYVFPSGYLQFGQAMTSQTTGRTYGVNVTIQYTKSSSNTRSLNLSKGSSEEIPIEDKKEELKELEEVKEVQDE